MFGLFVVGIGNDGLLAVLAQKRQVMLVGEANDFVVRAFADENGDRLTISIGNEIDGALHGGLSANDQSPSAHRRRQRRIQSTGMCIAAAASGCNISGSWCNRQTKAARCRS